MKIWVIGRNFPTPNNNMAGSFELEQAKMLSKKGHDVTYIANVFHFKKRIKKWGYASWKDETLNICCYSQLWFPERFRIYGKRIKENSWNRLLKTVKLESGLPDVIHIHYPTLLTIPSSIEIFQQQGVKVVATEHWTKVLSGNLKHNELNQLKYYVNNADAFICVGNPLKEAVLRQTRTRKEIHVIPNMVSTDFKPIQIKSNNFTFVATGRMVEHKQFDKIIEAFSKVFSKNDRVDLVIVGSGQEKKRLEKLVNKLHVENMVYFTGTMPRKKVAEVVAKSDVLICYSRFETFGVPVIEAWNCGKPVIASDCLGFLEYWNDRLGKIVPYNDDNLLASTMKWIKENIQKYDSKYIAEFAKNHFSEDTLYTKLIRLYE